MGIPKITAFNLPPKLELSKENKDTRDLHRYLSKQNLSRTIQFSKMEDNISAASILSSVTTHKAYFRGDSLLLTIDALNAATHLITLNLNTQTFNYRKLDYPKISCSPTDVVTIKPQGNSFLYQNTLFQIKSCPSGAKIGIRSLTEDSFIKEFQFTGRDTAISFQNTPILLKQERNKKVAKEKILTRPAELLARIDEYNVAIAAWENAQGQVEMVVGAQMLYIPQGGGGMTFMPGTPGFSTPYGAVPGSPGRWVSNPTYSSFSTSGLDRIVQFKSLLTEAGEHIPGEMKPNAHKRLQEAIEQQFDEKEFAAETIFYFNNAFYLGTYNKENQQFALYRYQD